MTLEELTNLKQALRENLIEFGLLPDNSIVDFDFAWGVGKLAQEIRTLRGKNKKLEQEVSCAYLNGFFDGGG